MAEILWSRLAKSIVQLENIISAKVKTSKCGLRYLSMMSKKGSFYNVFNSKGSDVFEIRNTNRSNSVNVSFDSEYELFSWLRKEDLDAHFKVLEDRQEKNYVEIEKNLKQEFTAFAKQLMTIPQVSDTFAIQREGGGKPICGMITKSGKGYGITWHKKYKNYRVFSGLGKYLDYKDQVVFSYNSLNELYEWLQTHDIDEEVSNAIPGQNLPCERSYDREAYEIAYGKPKRIKEG